MRLALYLVLGVFVQVLLARGDSGRVLQGDEPHYDDQARRFAAGETLEPDFVYPPGYARVLGLVYRVAGPGPRGVRVVQGGLLLGAALLLHVLLRRAGASRRAADAATLLFLADPQVAAFAGYLWPEVLHLFLMLASVALLSARDPRLPAAGGVVLGATLLTRSLLDGFLPVLLAAAALCGERSHALRRASLAAAGVVLVVAPAVAANGLRHGYWGVANSGPFNAWVGLNDPATRLDYDSVVLPAGPAYLASSPDHAERNRLMWARVRETLAREGLLSVAGRQVQKQYGRLFDRESFFTDQLPGGRWRPDEAPDAGAEAQRLWAYAAYALLLALAAAGLAVRRWRGRDDPALLPALFLAYNLALFLLLHVKTRYRVAFLPALLFFAAAAIDSWPVASRARRAAGLALAALLLLLAFGDGCPPRGFARSGTPGKNPAVQETVLPRMPGRRAASS